MEITILVALTPDNRRFKAKVGPSICLAVEAEDRDTAYLASWN